MKSCGAQPEKSVVDEEGERRYGDVIIVARQPVVIDRAEEQRQIAPLLDEIVVPDEDLVIVGKIVKNSVRIDGKNEESDGHDMQPTDIFFLSALFSFSSSPFARIISPDVLRCQERDRTPAG